MRATNCLFQQNLIQFQFDYFIDIGEKVSIINGITWKLIGCPLLSPTLVHINTSYTGGWVTVRGKTVVNMTVNDVTKSTEVIIVPAPWTNIFGRDLLLKFIRDWKTVFNRLCLPNSVAKVKSISTDKKFNLNDVQWCYLWIFFII